jgi:hypothetical protein
MERICRAVAEGLSLHAVAARERTTVDTLKGWLAEDEAFRARYEKARAIGRTFVLDDVLALADSLPGTGRADIRLKLAARKWWAAEVARDAAAKRPNKETRAEAKTHVEPQEKTVDLLADFWERVRVRDARDAEEERLREQAQT